MHGDFEMEGILVPFIVITDAGSRLQPHISVTASFYHANNTQQISTLETSTVVVPVNVLLRLIAYSILDVNT